MGRRYIVKVTDQESQRISGMLPRKLALFAESKTMTPYAVVGFMENALAPNATYTRGRIQYTGADAKGCSWGPQEAAPPCTATEVRNAQQLLMKYSAQVAK